MQMLHTLFLLCILLQVSNQTRFDIDTQLHTNLSPFLNEIISIYDLKDLYIIYDGFTTHLVQAYIRNLINVTYLIANCDSRNVSCYYV